MQTMSDRQSVFPPLKSASSPTIPSNSHNQKCCALSYNDAMIEQNPTIEPQSVISILTLFWNQFDLAMRPFQT